MKTILLRNWLSVMLSFASAFSPIQSTKEAIPQAKPVAVVASLPNPIPVKHTVRHALETAPLIASARDYTYVFAGEATCEGQPCANARVEVSVTSEHGVDTHNVTTGSDGRYTVSMPIKGEPNETLSWEIHALTSDFKKVDLEGHQILSDDSSIQMETPIAFVES